MVLVHVDVVELIMLSVSLEKGKKLMIKFIPKGKYALILYNSMVPYNSVNYS